MTDEDSVISNTAEKARIQISRERQRVFLRKK